MTKVSQFLAKMLTRNGIFLLYELSDRTAHGTNFSLKDPVIRKKFNRMPQRYLTIWHTLTGNRSISPNVGMSFASSIGLMVYLLKAIEVSSIENSAYRKAEALFEELKQRDRFYEGHISRACYYAIDFGRHQGLTKNELQQLYLATLFHDIGKVMIPAHIINKQAPLNAEERRVLRTHPALGEKICSDLGPFEEIASLVGSHHERPNGTGYPRGLRGHEISVLARILAVIEIYDALRSTRSYKLPFSLDKSLEILHQNGVKDNLDANVVEEFSRFVGRNGGSQPCFSPTRPQTQSIVADTSTTDACRRTTP